MTKVKELMAAVLVEELVELLVVDPVRPLDLAIQVWGPRPDVDVADGTLFEMPVNVGLKFALSVCTTWTRNGKRRRTSSMKAMAVR